MNSLFQFYIKRRFSRVFEMYPENNINFIDYNNAKKIEITLNTNDILFIPAGWFHYVLSETVDENLKLNIATSYFTEYKGCADCDILENKNYVNEIRIEDKNVDYAYYAKNSEPFYIKNSEPKIKWTLEKLKNHFTDKILTINKSKYKLFISNYIKEYNPECCQEIQMTFDEFLKIGKNDEINNYYLMQSENKKLNNLNNIPDIIKNETYNNFSLWINFGKNIYTNLHYDTHNNILVQMNGSKKIILFPPSERSKMHLINSLDTKILCKLKSVLRNI